MQRVSCKEIQNHGVEFLGSFEIRHVATPIEYIKVGIRHLFFGKACMHYRKEAILSPPDNERRNLYVVEMLHDGVEDIRPCAMDCRAGAEDVKNGLCPSSIEINVKMDVYQLVGYDRRIVHQVSQYEGHARPRGH